MFKVPFLVGPTASGKTAVALEAAERIGAQIISADSRQIYKGMIIGSAQPTVDEVTRVRHHFVNCLDIDMTFSAGEYGRQARARIEELYKKRIVPFVVGGSGLYISALADDFFAGPSADPDLRRRLKAEAEEKGVEVLYKELIEVDPEAASNIMPTDYRRIERALEIYHLTGKPISEARRAQANPPPYEPVVAGLQWPRDELYNRINLRALQMLSDGLIDEVKHLIEGKNLVLVDFLDRYNALNSVGYAEVLLYLKGEVDYEEMVRLIQRNTRRFAKRQISWFGRDDRIHWIVCNKDSTVTQIANDVEAVYRTAGIGEWID